MTDFSVFTDFSIASFNNATDAFGPVIGFETTQFQVTQRFDTYAGMPAYAVVTGEVIIQEVAGNSSLVNLVLKPIIRPALDFTPVKYFIYRGLKKSSFLTGSGPEILISPSSSTSDLINNLWTKFNQWKTDSGAPSGTLPSVLALGYDNTLSGDTLLAQIYRQSSTTEQIFRVEQGWTIGEFDPSYKGGFEIVLESSSYYYYYSAGPAMSYPDIVLDIVRKDKNTIVASSVGTPGDESITVMREREEILNYVDPAAYYGLHRYVGVDYKTVPTSSTSTKTGDDVFNLIVSRFYNKNTLYIDVRNENGYSVNYYKDNQGDVSTSFPGTHISLDLNGTGFSIATNYYSNNWPIYITTLTPHASISKKVIKLSVRLTYNPSPILYSDFAQTDDSFPDFPVKSDKFLTVVSSPTGEYTTPFYLALPNVINTSSTYETQAWILKFYDIRKEEPASPLPPTAIPNSSYLDNLFGPINLPKYINSTKLLQWNSGTRKKYINGYDQIGFSFMAEVGIAYSTDWVIFYANVIDAHTINPASFDIEPVSTLEVNSGTSSSGEVSSFNSDKFKLDSLQYTQTTLDSLPPYKLLPIKLFPNQATTLSKHQKFLSLSITTTEYNNLLTAASALDSSVHDLYLNVQIFTVIPSQDSSGNWYKTYDINVAGLDSSGLYSVQTPTGGAIYGYTLDDVTINTQNAFLTAVVPPTTSSYAVSNVSQLISYVRKVENYFSDPALSDPDSPHNIVTRIRVHSYGIANPMWGAMGPAFNLATSDLSNNAFAICHSLTYNPSITGGIELSGFLNNSDNWPAYLGLVSQADENTKADNPGIYVDVNGLHVDFGHAIYGLDMYLCNTVTAPFYIFFNILLSQDLAGFIADIATPIAENYYDRVQNKRARPGTLYYPSSPDLNRNYEINANFPDIFGDADAFGLYAAWAKVKSSNANFKFSDVLEHYYGPVVTTEHYTNRWSISCLYNNFISFDAPTGKYNWHPDDPSNDIDNRIINFATFWYNSLLSKFAVILNGGADISLLIEPLNLTTTDYSNITYVKTTYFNEVKARLIAEQGTSFLNP